ncbi:MAG: hemerythrin [Caldithrix sp. RBG_13_44_9]|nr:MAG: hemerythrin [Caldithrix sp. RBG_13_44_9]
MSEPTDNLQQKKALLKHLILQLHQGQSAATIKQQLIRLLGKIPYNLVVETEQELIAEGLPTQEVLKLCDVHGEALKGVVDLSKVKPVPPGHPVHTFQQENAALKKEISKIKMVLDKIGDLSSKDDIDPLWSNLQLHFNNILEVDKHYRRKENLLFPYLEKYGITGPPTVMWGKDDEIRNLLKGAIESLQAGSALDAEEVKAVSDWSLKPAITAADEMIYKEEEILFPMCLDTLTEQEWFEIAQQSGEIGYCLYDPKESWKPKVKNTGRSKKKKLDKISLHTGGFDLEELSAIFKFLPADITFVDKDDTVRFFSDNPNRIFDRNRAVLGRKVQFCHPPSSVHIVQKILNDFRSGRQNRAAFWINLQGKFIHIEYFALRNNAGEYLGTLEVTQDLTGLRKLEGEQKLLNYSND